MNNQLAESTSALKSRTETLIAAVRQSPLGQQVIPMESVVGWPYFQLRGRTTRSVCMSVPFGSAWKVGVGKTLLFVPSHVVQVDWESGILVKYFRPECEEMWSPELLKAPVATFPHETIRKYTIAEYQSLRAEVYLGYDIIGQSMQGTGKVDAIAFKRFQEGLRIVMEPGMEGFYRKLAPKFFEKFLAYLDIP